MRKLFLFLIWGILVWLNERKSESIIIWVSWFIKFWKKTQSFSIRITTWLELLFIIYKEDWDYCRKNQQKTRTQKICLIYELTLIYKLREILFWVWKRLIVFYKIVIYTLAFNETFCITFLKWMIQWYFFSWSLTNILYRLN